MLLDQVKEIFKSEPKVLKLSSPCYVFGDTHGNLRDVLMYERWFWRVSSNTFVELEMFTPPRAGQLGAEGRDVCVSG